IGGALVVIIAAVITHTPYYTTSSSLVFEAKIPDLIYSNNDRNLHSFEDWMRTQEHEIESHAVLSRAIQAYEDSGFVWRHDGETDKTAADRLRGRLNISQINNTQLLTVEMGSTNQVGLAEIINAVTYEYISHKDRQRKEKDLKKLTYLKAEKNKYNLRLDEAYQDLVNISRSYGTAIADEKNLYIYLDMFIDLRSRYNQVLTKRLEAENKLEALKNQKTRLQTLDVYDLQNTQLLLEMEQEINAKMIGLDPSSTLFGEYSKMLDEINGKNIRSARKYFIAGIDQEINTQAMVKESAQNTELDLQKEMKKAQYELMEINTAVLKTSTQRQAIERIIAIWDRINGRIEEIEIELFNPGRVQVLSAAQSPEFPNPSKLIKKVFLGIIAMVGLALGVAVLKEWLDKRVKRVSDIEKNLGFPAGGFVIDGSIENIAPEDQAGVYQKHPNSYTTELYNQLVVGIEREQKEFNSKTFAFFSLQGSSGVTTVAKNILAMLDAGKHEKIYVDLNPCTVEDEASREGECDGLIAWMEKHRSLEAGVKTSVTEHFEELKLGSLREMDIARIRPSSVQELVKRLKKKYKYIFIDGPSLLASSESQTIAQETDVSIIVVDAQKDTWPELSRAVHILDHLKIKVLSVVLNKVQIKRAGYLSKSIKAKHSKGRSILYSPQHLTDENEAA
ncbi:MAG: hypothetical protein H8E18_14530, partial [FCB group bacterium]|nr:hypothetical protein [FCB group bacterium]